MPAVLLARTVPVLRALQDEGLDVDAVIPGWLMTALQWAAMERDASWVRAVLDVGADTEVRDIVGRTALDFAVDDVASLRALVEGGADVNAFDTQGRTVLMKVSEIGSKDAAELLVNAGASVGVRDAAGESALTIALEATRGEDACATGETLCSLLLRSGADASDVALDELRRELGRAVRALDPGRVRRALDADAPANPASSYGNDLLDVAVEKEDLEILRMLLEGGADPGFNGTSCPLVWAIDKGNDAMVDLLLEHGAPPDGDCGGFNFSTTPIGMAVSRGRVDLVRRFLAAGANANAGGLPGVLCRAAMRGNVEITAALLDAGADIDARNHPGGCFGILAGATAITWAARLGHEEVVALLVSRGADLSIATADGVTPLRAAQELLRNCEERLAPGPGNPSLTHETLESEIDDELCRSGVGGRIEDRLRAAGETR